MLLLSAPTCLPPWRLREPLLDLSALVPHFETVQKLCPELLYELCSKGSRSGSGAKLVGFEFSSYMCLLCGFG